LSRQPQLGRLQQIEHRAMHRQDFPRFLFIFTDSYRHSDAGFTCRFRIYLLVHVRATPLYETFQNGILLFATSASPRSRRGIFNSKHYSETAGLEYRLHYRCFRPKAQCVGRLFRQGRAYSAEKQAFDARQSRHLACIILFSLKTHSGSKLSSRKR
jgi:hypothetical protein